MPVESHHPMAATEEDFPAYRGKRCLDVVLAVILLSMLVPIALPTALVILFLDGRPAIFWQRRVGLGGRQFAFPKFRSMVADAEARKAFLLEHNKHGPEGVAFKVDGDPRVTRVGRFIRRHSIDEIPQLWCVLRGDMSLVGPRPPMPEEVARYNRWQRLRLRVKPGLTGLWQVSGRSDLSFRRQVELDLEYARKQSVSLDVKLLLRTIPAVLTGKGAY